MTNKIDTVIFDIGSVLVSTGSPRNIVSNIGTEFTERERKAWHEYKIGKLDDFQYWQRIFEGSKHAGRENEFANAARTLHSISLPGEALPLVKPLHDNGYKIAILSNHVNEWAWPMIRNFGLDQLADPIIISSDVKVAKPTPAIYELVLERAGKRPEQCVFIDDKMGNIEPARKLGINTIHFPKGSKREYLESELKKLGVEYELTAAHTVPAV